MSDIDEVISRVFQLLIRECGETLSLEKLIFEISALRGKQIVIEETAMPIGITGHALALRDVDLISTRQGLDPLRQRMTILHELGHLALHHAPRFCANSEAETPTLADFFQYRHQSEVLARWQISYRGHQEGYNAEQEYAAEQFAQLCFTAFTNDEHGIPPLARIIYGDKEDV